MVPYFDPFKEIEKKSLNKEDLDSIYLKKFENPLLDLKERTFLINKTNDSFILKFLSFFDDKYKSFNIKKFNRNFDYIFREGNKEIFSKIIARFFLAFIFFFIGNL